MKKFLLFIAGIFFVGTSFAYDVIIYDENNNLLFMYPVEEGTTEITLNGNRSKNGNNYTFDDGFTGLNVHYYNQYGQEQSSTFVSDLYINGNYTVGYTGEQYLLLTEESCKSFNGYNPVFEITGTVNEIDTGNVFNNWSDNALKVLLSNVPGYIQYITIFAILLFLFSFLMRFKRKR